MSVLVTIEVSDRNEVERIAGLHVQILFKKAGEDKASSLLSTVSLSDDGAIGQIVIVEDSLKLNDRTSDLLIKAACNVSWNAVVINGAVMAGMKWRPLIPWLAEYVDVDLLPTLAHQIEAAVSHASSQA